jgi:hypothetical protein
LRDVEDYSNSRSEIGVSEVASGEDDFSYWVSLGLNNDEEPYDTLHIVCGKEADPVPGFQGLYFERSDQGCSEYDLASSIVVKESEITVSLKRRGREILGFSEAVRLLPIASIEDWRSTVHILQLMATTPNGGVISFEE